MLEDGCSNEISTVSTWFLQHKTFWSPTFKDYNSSQGEHGGITPVIEKDHNAKQSPDDSWLYTYAKLAHILENY